ncbi:MAG TPA: toast rack family protein [Anaerolineales bacterium]
MRKKRGLIPSLLILITVAFAATGCYQGVRVGDLQTKSQTVERGDAGAVNVEIQMGAGKLDVSGGASELLEASFTYNVEELNPQATYSGGRLEVKDSGVSVGIASLADLDEFRNEWDLKLNEDAPMEMKINLGAGPSNLALGALALTSLDVNGGAGDVTIDLTGDWRNDLDAGIEAGLGNIHLTLPRDVGARLEVDAGIGAVDASGLTRDGNTYTNDAYGVSEVTLRIHINGGVGNINVDLD